MPLTTWPLLSRGLIVADNPYFPLITSQHADKPRYMGLVDAWTRPFFESQEALDAMARAFDVDSAVGVQLDQVGLWVGVSRVLHTALEGVYFSLDIPGVGFDEGVWKGRFDPDTGLTSLPDDQFRLLIKTRIAANQWDGTIEGAYRVWDTIFADIGSVIFIQDNQDMSMIIGIAGIPLNAVSRALLTGGYIPLKPEGVRVNFYAIGTEPGPLFGFDIHNEALAGFDTGQWAQIIYPTLPA